MWWYIKAFGDLDLSHATWVGCYHYHTIWEIILSVSNTFETVTISRFFY